MAITFISGCHGYLQLSFVTFWLALAVRSLGYGYETVVVAKRDYFYNTDTIFTCSCSHEFQVAYSSFLREHTPHGHTVFTTHRSQNVHVQGLRGMRGEKLKRSSESWTTVNQDHFKRLQEIWLLGREISVCHVFKVLNHKRFLKKISNTKFVIFYKRFEDNFGFGFLVMKACEDSGRATGGSRVALATSEISLDTLGATSDD